MNSVSEILRDVKLGKLSPRKAERLLRVDAVAILEDVARVDTGRYARRGVPEIIYSKSKSVSQLKTILSGLLSIRVNGVSIKKKSRSESASTAQLPIVFSKITGEKQIGAIRSAVRAFNLEHSAHFQAEYYKAAGIATVNSAESGSKTRESQSGRVAIISAGTSDISALNETEVILKILGSDVLRFNDLGVAGLHRLAGPMREIVVFDPDVIVVAAGMEGALPSVVASLSSVPVIGLPTSIGYGFGGRGEASLMSMLQACPLGIAVVNIDAGLAAGVYAYLIARRAEDARRTSPEGKT